MYSNSYRTCHNARPLLATHWQSLDETNFECGDEQSLRNAKLPRGSAEHGGGVTVRSAASALPGSRRPRGLYPVPTLPTGYPSPAWTPLPPGGFRINNEFVSKTLVEIVLWRADFVNIAKTESLKLTNLFKSHSFSFLSVYVSYMEIT